MKDIVLLPTFNERKNVTAIIPEIFALLPKIHILVIDDNSPDGTAGAVEKLMQYYPSLSVLKRQAKTGLGDAYADAMKRIAKDTSTRAVITMDADGSHQPQYLPELLANIETHDVVIGSRYVKGGGIEHWEAWRKNLSRFGNLYTRMITGLPINDCTAGLMCIKKELLAQIDLDRISSSGYAFLIELKFYLIQTFNARVKEIPIVFKSRRGGESKMSKHIISEGVCAPWKLWRRRLKKNSSHADNS